MSEKQPQESMNEIYMEGFNQGFFYGASWSVCAVGAMILLWLLVG